MSIPVHCPHCRAAFRVASEMAGRRGKCPSCLQVIRVGQSQPAYAATTARAAPAADQTAPAAVSTASPPPPRRLQPPGSTTAQAAAKTPQRQLSLAERHELILNGFQGRIQPVRAPISYRIGIVLVAAVMLMLPLVYILLIIGVAVLVYLHLTTNTGLLAVEGMGRAGFFMVLLYGAPAVVGAILIAFMIKPLFARSSDARRRRSLTRDGEPLLFAFVDRLCVAVGAPRPVAIDVDCDVNASASFRRGIWSMFSNDLVLTIGMPLVAGLTMRQFAGVLAHEFGHFAQGAGMRLTYIVRSISWWLTRAVYERDTWDESLDSAAGSLDLRVAWVLHLARFFVWLTRRLLWVLMMIGHAVAGYMLRQMEFDADRHEARLAGSEVFESTARRLMALNIAHQRARADLAHFYQEGRLGDNLPKLMMHNVHRIPPEVQARIDQLMNESQTGIFDTHPCDRERIANARQENAPGVFQVDGPASHLFHHFSALAKNVTWDFYRAIFGSQFKPTDMHPTELLLGRLSQEEDAQKTLRRYWQNTLHMLRPLILPSGHLQTPARPRALAQELKEARRQMLQQKDEYQRTFESYDDLDTAILQADQATVLFQARLNRLAAELGFSDQPAARQARLKALQKQARLNGKLQSFETIAGQRFYAALQLLRVPQVAQKLSNAKTWQYQSNELLSTVYVLNSWHRSWMELREAFVTLRTLCAQLESGSPSEQLVTVTSEHCKRVWTYLRQLREAMYTVPYPFEHARGQVSIGEYVLRTVPASGDLGGIYYGAEEMLTNLAALFSRALSELAVMAEQVEAVVGLVPLPDPVNDEG